MYEKVSITPFGVISGWFRDNFLATAPAETTTPAASEAL